MNTDTITETIKWHLLSLWKVETPSKVMEATMKFQYPCHFLIFPRLRLDLMDREGLVVLICPNCV